eukprot:10253458-Lingulodinium_polyedra.AAC.1
MAQRRPVPVQVWAGQAKQGDARRPSEGTGNRPKAGRSPEGPSRTRSPRAKNERTTGRRKAKRPPTG